MSILIVESEEINIFINEFVIFSLSSLLNSCRRLQKFYIINSIDNIIKRRDCCQINIKATVKLFHSNRKLNIMIFDNMRFVHNINIEIIFQIFKLQNIKFILIFIDFKFDNLFIRNFLSFECFKIILLNQSKINCKYNYSRVVFMIIENIIKFNENIKFFSFRNRV